MLDGRARDLRTDDDGTATVLAEAALRMVTDPGRIIEEIGSSPELRPGWRAWRASRRCPATGGGWPRPGRPTVVGTPLYQLLDDVPGATLVSGAAWQRWYDMDVYLEIKADVSQRVMTDVCTGYQQGSSALEPDGTLRWRQDRQPAVDIDAVDDDLAWHAHPRPEGVTMRRARRIDVWADGPVLYVDAFFQDSSTLPEGGRQAIHEYTLTAAADLETGTVRAITPVARVLPVRRVPAGRRATSPP